jgi:hypothetical protein
MGGTLCCCRCRKLYGWSCLFAPTPLRDGPSRGLVRHSLASRELEIEPHRSPTLGGGVWQDNLDGTYTQLDDDYYVPATGWSYLALYLMGLIAPSEVPDFFILRNLVPQGRDANGHPIFKGDRTKVTIQDVIAAEGPRLPDVQHSQRDFNTGMVVVVEHGKTPSKELLERTEGIRQRWMDYWTTTTGHRSTMTANP